MKEITAKERVDGSVITVPAPFVRDAAFEAIEAGVKLLVIVTERTPRYEVAQVVELARMRGTRIIGPNCLGIISPGKAKMGGIGGPAANTRQAYTPGHIGVMSRSGGMATEISELPHGRWFRPVHNCLDWRRPDYRLHLRRANADFEADPDTHAIVIYTEPGGPMDAQLAKWVKDNNSRLPIVAFMAGRFMDKMPGMRFGHAGTIVEGSSTPPPKTRSPRRGRHLRSPGDRRYT